MQFVDVGGVSIAWHQFGDGPDLLIVPPLVSNVELVWEHEYYRRYLTHLARHVRVTAFDKRGVGLSDRFDHPPTLEQRTEDILAVIDAAGLGTVTLAGASEGGLMAQLFTSLHPERVGRLALINSSPGTSGFIAMHTDANGSTAPLVQKLEKFERLATTWGREPQFMVDWFCPSRSNDAAFVRWIGRLQRQSATATDLRRQLESMQPLDAVDRLHAIEQPTLILHCSDDAVMPVAAAHYLGERIPDASVLELPNSDHFVVTSPGWLDMADRFIEFVSGRRPARRVERRVQTIVFTDIVDSTRSAIAAGDEAWRRLLDRHDHIAWTTVGRHGGTIVKSTGDGLLARFDAPSAAVACASDLRRALRDVDLRIRCGIHTGEIELRDNDDIAGQAVNLAARVESMCDDDAIFASSTVVDLMLGSATTFEDRGEFDLKGFERRWRLYELACDR